MALRKILISTLVLFCFTHLPAQLRTTGYVGLMPSCYCLEQPGITQWESLLHNRINMSYDFSPAFTGVLQLRNRLIWGKSHSQMNNYANLLDRDPGFADLSVNLATGSSAVLNTTIDRLWCDFFKGPIQVRVGRQRINWGQAFIWNPNDIFNTYSFFDFDYPERPGIDGLRVQYFTGTTSLTEGVFKIDAHNRKTIALRHRFNAAGYDWQCLAGRLNDRNWVGGIGWSGHLKKAGFYGEATTLFPDKKDEDLILVATLGADYTFPNALLIRTEMLYSSNLPVKIGDFSQFINAEASLKTLSVARYSCFASLQYPITPLFTGTFSGMLFPGSTGWYMGPSMEYSLKTNLFLTLFVNVFRSKLVDSPASTDLLGALRLKWHF